jgi:hypothetical protein
VFNSVFTLETTIGANTASFGLAMEGTAAPPAQITTIPNSLDFGNVDVGSTATMTFDLGDEGGLPLTIVSSTPPTTNGFSALSNPYNDVIAANTSNVETVQFAPTTTGSVSSTWLVEGNDGNGVQTVTMTGTGVTAPPPAPPSSSPTPPSTPTPVTLTITTLSGRVGTPLTLATSGDPNGGSLSYSVRNGTAAGCVISRGALSATRAGSCVVVATKSAVGSNPAISSSPTDIAFRGQVTVARPMPVTITFTGSSSELTALDEHSLSDFAQVLKSRDVVTCTGYATSNPGLALRRATAVATFLTNRIKVQIKLETVSRILANKVTISTTA